MITKEEWIDWKANPVTRAFYEACVIRIEDSKEVLATTAGRDQYQDSFMSGFIQAYREMQDFKIEDLDES